MPKFHYKLNAVEGLWRCEKEFVWKYSDQKFSKILQLIPQARKNFVEKTVFMKSFRRFRKAMSTYEQEPGYANVLWLFFSNHCSQTVISHRRITYNNMNDIQIVFFSLLSLSSSLFYFSIFSYRNLLVISVRTEGIRCWRYTPLILTPRVIVSVYMTVKVFHQK